MKYPIQVNQAIIRQLYILDKKKSSARAIYWVKPPTAWFLIFGYRPVLYMHKYDYYFYIGSKNRGRRYFVS